MNSNELVIYAAETKAIIQVLWGLLLIACLALLAVSLLYVTLRLQKRAWKRREVMHARQIAEKARELKDTLQGVEALRTAVRRAEQGRQRAEEKLREQSTEIDALRGIVVNIRP